MGENGGKGKKRGKRERNGGKGEIGEKREEMGKNV